MATLGGRFPASTPAARPGDAPYPLSQGCQYLALWADHRLSLVRSPTWPPMGVQECGPSVAAAVAVRWHARDHASPDPRACRGTRDDAVAVRSRRRLVFPLAK